MKRDVLRKVFVILLVVLSVLVYASKFTPELFKQLAGAKNKIPTIPIPAYERFVLPNGMVCYIAQDKRLPIVEIKGYVRYGILNETPEIAGISAFMLDLMNSATKNRDEFTLAEEKELKGVSISFSAQPDYYQISASALSDDVEALFELLSDELRNPEFRADNFARKQQEYMQSFAQAKTQEQPMARRYFYTAIYGENHPYSFSTNYALLSKVMPTLTPDIVEEFYSKVIVPDRIVLAIAGDFEIEELKNLLLKYFGDWKSPESERFELPKIEHTPPYGKVFVLDRPTSTQAYLMMGYEFFDHRFPERIAFLMANRVYGSGMFNCRLMKSLRTEKGYVYGVSSSMQLYEVGGEYYVTTSVKYDAVADTIRSIIEEMKAIKSGEKAIGEDELFEVINLYNAQFPDAYKDTISILDSVVLNAEIRGRSPNYVNEFIQAYNALDAKTANEVFSKYSYPEKFVVVLVGQKDKIVQNLEANGYTNYEVIEFGK